MFGELHFTQISLNFETSCCHLKIGGLVAKEFVVFYYFHFERKFDIIVEQKRKLQWKGNKIQTGKS